MTWWQITLLVIGGAVVVWFLNALLWAYALGGMAATAASYIERNRSGGDNSGDKQ